MKVRQRLHTRATPPTDPLAGLVRYGLILNCVGIPDVDEKPNGEYVLYSEAAKIIAAKDVEIEKLKDGGHESFKSAIGWQERAKAAEADNHQLKVDASKHAHDAETVRRQRDEEYNLRKAAEAELAQIKAQEPAMWLCVRDYEGSDRAITASSPSRRDILKAEGYEITPLYFPPITSEGGRD